MGSGRFGPHVPADEDTCVWWVNRIVTACLWQVYTAGEWSAADGLCVEAVSEDVVLQEKAELEARLAAASKHVRSVEYLIAHASRGACTFTPMHRYSMQHAPCPVGAQEVVSYPHF